MSILKPGDIFQHLDHDSREILDHFPTYFSNMNRANAKLKWKSSDTLEGYRANVNKPDFIKYKDYWLNEQNFFEYKFNNYGFRTYDNFNTKDKGVITLGCSLTEGIGLPYEMTWGYRIAKHLKVKHWNLSLAAMGLHTAYRLLLGAFQFNLKFDKVFLFIPPPFRHEFMIRENEYVKKELDFKQDYLHWFMTNSGEWFSTAGQHDPGNQRLIKMLLDGDESQATFERVRMVSAIAGLAKLCAKEFYYQDSTFHNRPVEIERAMSVADDICPNIPARDYHWHSKRQYNIYSRFLDQMKPEKNESNKGRSATKLL